MSAVLPPFLSAVVVGAIGLLFLAKWASTNRSLETIPTVGYDNPLLRYVSAIKFLFKGREVLEEGYRKYKTNPGVFKTPTMDGWLIVVAGKQYIDEVRRAPDDTLSFNAATERSLQIRYTLGRELETNQYHVGVVRSQLTRNIGALFDLIRDEVATSFSEVIPAKSDGSWTKVNTTKALQQIICRTSNRMFVGLPLCRNEDYIKLNIEFTIDVVLSARFINLFPDFFKPVVGNLLTTVPRQVKRALKHLQPIIEERQRLMAEHGDNWTEKPNDFLQWLIDTAEGEEKTARLLSQRILTVNFAAIHTSTLSMSSTLYYLAAYPQYQEVLREEAESVVSTDGWTKMAMGKMRKIDSFIKEVQRMEGLGIATMGRGVLKPFTFSNGITVPANELISCISREVHHDDENYSNPDAFDPWRFSNIREEDGEGTKHQFVATSMEFLNFGHGRHACPGRFFAANELKGMLAHIVLNYDVKFEDGTGLPTGKYFELSYIPPQASVLFRKRSSL